MTGREVRVVPWLSGGIEVCWVVMAVDVRCGVAWCYVVWRCMLGWVDGKRLRCGCGAVRCGCDVPLPCMT